MKRGLGSAVGIFLALTGSPAHAQSAWPERAVRFIVPSSPGGGTDLYARQLAQALSESLKQQFIVDNRPGASRKISPSAPPERGAPLFSASACSRKLPARGSCTCPSRAWARRCRRFSAAR